MSKNIALTSKHNRLYIRFLIIALLLCMLVVAPGCFVYRQVGPEVSKAYYGPDYKITNFYRDPDLYNIGIRRVAVLEFVNESEYREASKKVRDAFLVEFKKTGTFAVATVSDGEGQMLLDTLKRRGTIDYEKAAALASYLNVDALVIGRITKYFPYNRSPVIGLDVAMIYPEQQSVVWQVDELFDSADYRVMNSIRNYFTREFTSNVTEFNFELFLFSITRYAQFVTHEIASTLLVKIPMPPEPEAEIEIEEEIAGEIVDNAEGQS